MGVNIAAIIPKEEIKLEDLKGKIIAIDAYNAIYQFLSSIRQPDGTSLMDSQGNVTSHLQGLLTRSVNLMTQGIKLVYVFDGTPPALKLHEQQERQQRKEAAEYKYHTAVEEEDVEEMHKYAKQFSRLNETMVAESKILLTALGIPVVQAPSEAEGQAAHMCKKGDVWATASQDADALLFGTPRLIRNLTLSQKRKLASGSYVITFLELITLQDVLKELQISHDQLITLGILVGTDFNIGGVKGIGPKKALKLIRDRNNDETIFTTLNATFDWRAIRNIFEHLPVTNDYTLQWKIPDVEKIKTLLVTQHEFSEERVDAILAKLDSVTKERSQKGLGDYL